MTTDGDLEIEVDPFDVQFAVHASGLLATFNRAGVLGIADVQVARTIGRLGGESDESVLLAIALAVRAVRMGSVCVDVRLAASSLASPSEETSAPIELAWPDVEAWQAACQVSPVVAVGVDGDPSRPLRLIGDLLYLDRYWRQEQLVRAEFAARSAAVPSPLDAGRVSVALVELFPTASPDHQRLAAAACATGAVTVIAGGPGTGKTTTIARLLALLIASSGQPLRIALAAPTGKAAARLQEAVAADAVALGLPLLAASTLHRLLGWKPGSRSRFKHDRTNRLPYDVVVIDETSMVSLTLMSRLLEAVRPDARLVLVGDPDQLASVEAGAVLGDLVHRPARTGPDDRLAALQSMLAADISPADEVEDELRKDVVRLRHQHRFGAGIGDLANAIRTGDPDATMAVLRSGSPSIEFAECDPSERGATVPLAALKADIEACGTELVLAARAGDVDTALNALDRHRLLCAHREGPYGVGWWSSEIERWLAAAIGGFAADGEWWLGRPLLATSNDYELRLYNGDTGVIVAGPQGKPMAAFVRGDVPVLFAPSRLSGVQTVHAMTVHRSQGSLYVRVSVMLPPVESPLLTRELFYTAASRAQDFVRVIGTEAAVRRAVETPIVRASGLRLAQ
jgi:exodeoxyribonuclease V alpha subunit